MALKDNIIEFLGILEGYHQTCKMLHWSTTNKSEHVLVDEIDKDVLEFEDRIAEVAMGKLKTRFGIGSLKAMLPNAENLDDMIKEYESDVLKLKKDIGDKPEYSGFQNILDDMLESIDKYYYLKTLK